jgi:Tfp pilus assembly protein PilF
MSLKDRCAAAAYRLCLQGLLILGLRRHATVWTERRQQAAPDDLHALATRAQLQADEGDLASAAVSLRRLLAVEPRQSAAWFNLGYVLEQQGQAAEAETAFRRAIETNAGMDRAWYGLALSLIAQQRWDEAEAALHRTNELQPLSPFGWVQLARLHVRRREPERAWQVIEHLRGFEPRAAAQLVLETGLGASLDRLAGEGATR